MRSVGIILPVKQAVWSVALQAPVFSGSRRKIGLLWLSRAEKLPLRKSCVGTLVSSVVPRRRRKPSQEKNQNILSRRLTFGKSTGPPTVTPYWFKRNGVFPKLLRLAKNSLASKT